MPERKPKLNYWHPEGNRVPWDFRELLFLCGIYLLVIAAVVFGVLGVFALDHLFHRY